MHPNTKEMLPFLFPLLKLILKNMKTISTNHVSATVGTAITPIAIVNTNVAATYYSISPAISNGLSFNKT
jgi:hypothetical protein